MISDNRIYHPDVVDLHDVVEFWGYSGRVTLKEYDVELPPNRGLDLVTE